ncbi:MAG TPA: hypothetical protein VMH22_07705 [bacterium]|nr:hypothetical protein [bacterium]
MRDNPLHQRRREQLGFGSSRDWSLKGDALPYDVFIESEKRPQVIVDADRVEELDGYLRFFKGGELVASFKEQKVVGYMKLTVPI